ncbi:MAG TPA: hypothetical protein VME47_19545 [Acetobacteraceae bacterium]|nr:hypothetical protein [Acetobacteraceae bacterium]
MNPTDEISPDLFFADMLLSLKHAMARRGEHFFPARGDAAAESHWEPVATRTGGVGRLPVTGRDADSLLDALAVYWQTNGEAKLTQLQSGLKALRRQARAGGPADPGKAAQVSDFVYPLH